MQFVNRCAAVFAVTAAVLFAGCATDAPREPVAFVSAAGAIEPSILFTRDTEVRPPAGYSKVLKAGSTWKYVGTVPRGKVYAPVNDVFMLSGRNFQEAYCVIATGPAVVGFYLPVEQAYVALTSAVPVSIKYQ
jgi:hypothetical protein